MTAPAIEARAIAKAFSGVAALREVDFTLGSGEARGLIGENGAGKSTLINVVSGALQPDAGELRLDGEVLRVRSPQAALAHGIGTVHQQNWLVPTLTALQNVELGHERVHQPLATLARGSRPESRIALDFVGMLHAAHREVESLSLAERQLVAIARAYARGSRVLIFDEPTAALSPVETQYLFEVIDRLRASGTAVLYVTHRLEELPRVVDRVSVMRAGRIVDELPCTATERQFVDRMAGAERVEHESEVVGVRRQATRAERTGEPILVGAGLTDGRDAFHDVDLALHGGEVVALVGLPDSGAIALARTIAGAGHLRSGRLTLDGQSLSTRAPWRAVRGGVGYLAGDRKLRGVIPNFSVRETVTLSALPHLSPGGVLRRRAERRLARELSGQCEVRAASLTMPITALSGGNQQKALFARTIATRPRVIVCEDPTAGVDPGGREALYELLGNACVNGAGVLLCSSDLREVALVSDRALVFWRGQMVAELARDQLNVAALMAAQFNQGGET
jgi:ribose transport system ATP-binding protein